MQTQKYKEYIHSPEWEIKKKRTYSHRRRVLYVWETVEQNQKCAGASYYI